MVSMMDILSGASRLIVDVRQAGSRPIRRCGLFRSGAAERLVEPGTNQVWRMALLAASLLERGEFDFGCIAVLSLAEDHDYFPSDGSSATITERQRGSLSCSILTSKVWSLRETQAGSP